MAATVSSIDRHPPARYADRADLIAKGDVAIAPVIGGKRRPLHLSMYALERDASLLWSEPPKDQLVMIWRGNVVYGTNALGPGDVFAVEHGASASITAQEQAELLVFERPIDHAALPQGAGGHVHVIPAESLVWGADETRPGAAHALLLDAACPDCALWLHASRFPGGYQGTVHSHSEDEIILVTAGTIILGQARFGPGAVLAVDANTIYSFSAGEEGVTFLNYRPSPSLYIRAGSSEPAIDERDYMLEARANRATAAFSLME